MKYFAQINDNNIVTQVIVIADSDATDEATGIAFCKSLYGSDTDWVETKIDGSVHTRYAGKGMYYDSSRDAFYPPKPYPSWVMDETEKMYVAPVAKPSDHLIYEYTWSESGNTWIKAS